MFNFFCYPDRVRMRVSQVLVLPPFQRQGVGRALLEAVYAMADTRHALDVTVSSVQERARRAPTPASPLVPLHHSPSPGSHAALLRAVFALAHHPQCPKHCIEEICPTLLAAMLVPECPFAHTTIKW